MKTWQKVLIPTLLVVLIAGGRLFFVWKARQDPGVTPPGHGEVARALTTDELAVVRQMIFATFDQARDLEGKPVWIKAGYSLPYYPFAGGHVVFAKRVGVLPAAEKLAVTKLVKAVAPAGEDNRVPHGSRQYFAIFTLGESPGLFAAPIGYAEGSNEAIFADQLFYYDDPRKIYDNWPADVWAAVASHQPKVGMTEAQVRMAVGILMHSDSTSEGNRTVTYDAGGKSWTVTFSRGVATGVKAG